MPTDTLFPFYTVFVEYIFGSIGLALLILGGIFALMLILGRASRSFLYYWMWYYFAIVGTLYIGALALVFIFILSGSYFFYNIIKLAFREG